MKIIQLIINELKIIMKEVLPYGLTSFFLYIKKTRMRVLTINQLMLIEMKKYFWDLLWLCRLCRLHSNIQTTGGEMTVMMMDITAMMTTETIFRTIIIITIHKIIIHRIIIKVITTITEIVFLISTGMCFFSKTD